MANINKQSQHSPRAKNERVADPIHGVFIGEIISSRDATFTGRIKVFLPALGKSKEDTAGYFDCIWTSPFAGAVNTRNVGPNLQTPADSMQSYGMWMVPPDPGSLVLVSFADGNQRYPIIMGCMFPDFLNNMVPGMPGSRTYGSSSIPLPAVEKNKRVSDINHNDTTRPAHHEIAEAITKQGLIKDARRGAGTSGARRESPSEVFGLLTPGPLDPNDPGYRLGGHQVVLDDNLNSRLVRFRTAAGQQILLDDISGSIYMINKNGEAWVELDAAGNFSVFGEGSFNMRAKGDFNLRADKDINIEAGGDINIKAAGDMESKERGASYVGPNSPGDAPAGYGGSINLESARNFTSVASQNMIHNSLAGEMHFLSDKQMNFENSETNFLSHGAMNFSSSQTISVGASGRLILVGSDDTVVKGSRILLNSGGPDATDASPATAAESIATVDVEDVPIAKPEYEYNSTNTLPTNGLRPGDPTTYQTIVGTFLTAEPFNGHNYYDPVSEDIGAIDSDETLIENLPAGSNGITDSAGNVVLNDVNSPAGFIQQPESITIVPPSLFASSPGVNGFTLPGNMNLTQLPAMDNITSALSSAMPSINGIAVNAGGAALSGLGTTLQDSFANFSAVPITAGGVFGSISSGATGRIASILEQARALPGLNPDQLVQALSSQGITVTTDGLSQILRDRAGNTLVDISGGTGPLASAHMMEAALQEASATVAQVIRVPLSANQLASLSSFASHVGSTNFSSSGVVESLNAGNYADVPRQMMAWSVGSRSSGSDPTVREDYMERREFEGELFTTPDNIGMPALSDRMTFAQITSRLRLAKNSQL